MTERDSEVFTSLTEQQARSWVDVGKALHDAERLSKVSPSGRSWQDILRERLEALGHPMSVGHLSKIRRAYGFLKKFSPEYVSDDQLLDAKISAVEVAERLHRIAPEQGVKALEDIFADEPVTYVELQSRYDEAVNKNPEMRSVRQLAWAARRAGSSPAPKQSAPPQESVEVGKQGPSQRLYKSVTELIQNAWSEGWNEAKLQSDAMIAAKAQEISQLTTMVANLKKQINGLEEENDILQEEAILVARKYRELRGD